MCRDFERGTERVRETKNGGRAREIVGKREGERGARRECDCEREGALACAIAGERKSMRSFISRISRLRDLPRRDNKRNSQEYVYVLLGHAPFGA